jgi:hypothetical protein
MNPAIIGAIGNDPCIISELSKSVVINIDDINTRVFCDKRGAQL